jgi:hypothetical protein
VLGPPRRADIFALDANRPADDVLEGTWWAKGITCRDAVAAEARAGFTARELGLGGRGRLASIAECEARGAPAWDTTVTFRDGRFLALCGSPTDGHVCVNGTYRIVGDGVVRVNDGYSAPTIRFAVDKDRLTLDVVRMQLVQPGMTRVNRLEDWSPPPPATSRSRSCASRRRSRCIAPTEADARSRIRARDPS